MVADCIFQLQGMIRKHCGEIHLSGGNTERETDSNIDLERVMSNGQQFRWLIRMLDKNVIRSRKKRSVIRLLQMITNIWVCCPT